MFRRTMRVPNSPVCMLYIICWAVEVSLQHVFSPLGRGSLILDCPGQTRALLRLQQPVDLVHALKTVTVKGMLFLVPPRTPRSSAYVVYAHAVYVVICYMSLTCICLSLVLAASFYMYMSVICCYMLYVYYMLYVCNMSSLGGVVRVRLYS